MDFLETYYQNYDEDGRLLSQHGQVEYITTQKYIHEYLAEPILEIGAGTGRYSVTLAKEGFDVTAIDLVAHNLEILRQKLDGSEKITVMQGNALLAASAAIYAALYAALVWRFGKKEV